MSVLLVEDEVLVAMTLQDFLEDLGYRDVTHASTLAAAQSFLAINDPTLAILDINVGPDLVYPVAAELRARGVPFVFCSAKQRQELPPEWSGEMLLPKPFSLPELTAALTEVAERIAAPSPAPFIGAAQPSPQAAAAAALAEGEARLKRSRKVIELIEGLLANDSRGRRDGGGAAGLLLVLAYVERELGALTALL